MFNRKKKTNNTEFYEKVGDSFDRLFTKVSQKLGLHKLGEKIEVWANGHKKAMFGIIMSFLSVGTVIIILTTAISFTKPKKDFENPKLAIDTLQSALPRHSNRIQRQVDEYLLMKKYQDEFEALMAKDSLTRKDSIRLVEIYDEITEYQIKSYYDGKN